jgi:hypothetical protein
LRLKELCPHAIGLAAVFVFIFLVPQRPAGQESSSPNSRDPIDLETSVSGPLQQRLEATYPDSFKTGVDIFWEPNDCWVSPEVFGWWVLRLADDDLAGLTWEAAERMQSRISGASPVFSSPDGRRICAVVGPSRNLLGSGYGDFIDAHGVVIRMNRAPTNDYDSDVGKRTTHHVMWPRDLEEHDFDRRAFLLMNPITLHNPDVFDRIVTLAEKDLRWDLERVRIIHPEFVQYLHESWAENRGDYPSTGFIALMVALHVCDEVDVFGFGADAQGRWDRYYEDDPVDVSYFHPADFEGRLRREMEEKGILKVFRGSRPYPSSRTEASPQD